MLCASCSFDNRDDARFCGECGATFAREVRCESCGRTSPPRRKFCDDCGHPLTASAPAPGPHTYTPQHLAEKILRSRSALEGERKQVTVLFADVKGSMELAEQVDAEAWHRILDRFFHILADGVHRFEGTVNQYTGDGIMALFGAPIAHEDHAQRACWAALHLRDALRPYADELRVSAGLNFSVRMGLNSGEVVVGKIGDDLRMDYTAQGLTVGLAARMENLAEPGKTLLTQYTAELAAGYFALRDLGPAQVKGVSEPLRIYELEGVGEVQTRFDLSRQRGFSRFVGRMSEMRALQSALEAALEGRAAVVGVVAEAGTGKSRLCHEFAKDCRARGIEVYEGHAVSHGKMVPLLPLLELLRGLFGVLPRDTAEAARRRIAGAIFLLDPELQESLPLWFDFLGVPDPARPLPGLEPEARQTQLVSATRRLVQARSRSGPSVLLLEDLHWLDDASDALLAGLVEVLHGSRTLLLTNFRPEYRAAWMERASVPYQEIALRPLGDEAIEQLLDDLVGSEPRLAPLRRRVRERTGGNPFFVEEVVRSLFDQGILTREGDGPAALARDVDEVQIPATVQAVLAARIDRLPEAHKRVLQTAAVIGKTFSEPVLRSALEAEDAPIPLASVLSELAAADFVQVEALHPEWRYAFRHPLTQEVAYRSQLGDRRARVHAAVARAIEAAYREHLDEHAALLAHHWAGAGEALRAAEWHRRAAEWLGMRDRREMMRHWRQVLALLAGLPESPEVLALAVMARGRMLVNGVFVGMAEDQIGELFREGLALAERLPAVAPRLLLRLGYGLTRLFAGAIGESLGHMREVLRLAEESQDRMLRYVARVSMLSPLIQSGFLLEAVSRSEEAERLSGGDLSLGSEMTRFSPFGVLLASRAQALIYLGRVREVWPILERALEIGQQRGDAELLSMARAFHAQASEFMGDKESVMLSSRQMVELAESVDSPQLRGGAYGSLGGAHILYEQWEEAVEALSLALDLMRETGTGRFLEVPRLAERAEARRQLGDLVGAHADIERALLLARERGTPLTLMMTAIAQARLLAAEGETAAAELVLTDAASLVERTGARAFLPDIHLGRAALAQRRGDRGTRRRELEAARDLLAEMGATARVEQVEREM